MSQAPVSSSPRRRWLVLLGLIVLAVVGANIRPFWLWADFDTKPTFLLGSIGGTLTVGCVFGGLIWLFLFSGFPGRVRAILFGVFLLSVVAVVAMTSDWELDGELRPRFRPRWRSSPAEALALHREQQSAREFPPVDLTVDRVRDFPRFRGENNDGRVTGSEVFALSWDKQAPKLLWKYPCGGGFAGFAVAGNVLVTLEQRGDNEAVVCYDRASGAERWTHEYAARFRHAVGGGPRATPTIADGRIFSLGALGDLVCLNANGKLLWSRNILEDNRANRVTWGMSGSPLVEGNLVVVQAGVGAENVGRSLVVYNVEDGSRVRGMGNNRAGYSSPQSVRLHGRKQVLMFDAEGLGSYEIDSGNELWHQPWRTSMDMNIMQPLVIGDDRVFLSSELGNGSALIKVSKSNEVEVVWKNRQMSTQFANPVYQGSAVYGLSGGRLVCLDVQTGRRHWRGTAHYGHGQVLALGGAILVQSEEGEIALVPADTKAFRETGRLPVFTGKTWNTPALAGGRLYLRNAEEMACVELPLLKE